MNAEGIGHSISQLPVDYHGADSLAGWEPLYLVKPAPSSINRYSHGV